MYALSMLKALSLMNIQFHILVPKGTRVSEAYSSTQMGFFSNLNVWEQLSLPWYLLGKKNALLLNFCNSAPLLIAQQIVTIHDLAFEQKNVKWFSFAFKKWYRFLIPRICKRALAVLTVSNVSKKELENRYGLNKEKVYLVQNVFHEPTRHTERLILGEYLLVIGAENPRKNASFVLKHLDEIKKRGLKLVILTSNSEVFPKNKLEKNSDIIYLNYVSDPVYYSVIKHAKALIYLSFYEGFGIPILESLCLQTPVICLDLPVFKESFGECPIYLTKTKSFATVLDELESKTISEYESKRLMETYSLENSAKQLTKILQTLN